MSLSSDEGRFVHLSLALSSIVSAIRRARFNTEVGWIRPGPSVQWCAVGTEQWRIQEATQQTIENFFIHNLVYQFLINYDGEWNLLKRLKFSAAGWRLGPNPTYVQTPLANSANPLKCLYIIGVSQLCIFYLLLPASKEKLFELRTPNFLSWRRHCLNHYFNSQKALTSPLFKSPTKF